MAAIQAAPLGRRASDVQPYVGGASAMGGGLGAGSILGMYPGSSSGTSVQGLWTNPNDNVSSPWQDRESTMDILRLGIHGGDPQTKLDPWISNGSIAKDFKAPGSKEGVVDEDERDIFFDAEENLPDQNRNPVADSDELSVDKYQSSSLNDPYSVGAVTPSALSASAGSGQHEIENLNPLKVPGDKVRGAGFGSSMNHASATMDEVEASSQQELLSDPMRQSDEDYVHENERNSKPFDKSHVTGNRQTNVSSQPPNLPKIQLPSAPPASAVFGQGSFTPAPQQVVASQHLSTTGHHPAAPFTSTVTTSQNNSNWEQVKQWFKEKFAKIRHYLPF
ncbi:hypothetical protein H4R35_001306 [Dimargaris xerosporica]|nr:hypothetical protein H4R35_001306 [Dimargaris xerosporica]